MVLHWERMTQQPRLLLDPIGSVRASVYVGAFLPLVPVCASVAWSLPSIVGLHVLTNDGGILKKKILNTRPSQC